jgi:hypothetical protein
MFFCFQPKVQRSTVSLNFFEKKTPHEIFLFEMRSSQSSNWGSFSSRKSFASIEADPFQRQREQQHPRRHQARPDVRGHEKQVDNELKTHGSLYVFSLVNDLLGFLDNGVDKKIESKDRNYFFLQLCSEDREIPRGSLFQGFSLT